MTSIKAPSRILSTLVYVVKDNDVLMVHRVKKKNDIHIDKYNGLGGKIENGETPLECAIREVKEESQLEITDIKFKGNMYFPKFDKDLNDWQVYLYRVDGFKGELMKNSPEGELIWVNRGKLLELNLWEGDKIFIPHVFSDEIIDARFTYKEGKLIDHEIRTL